MKMTAVLRRFLLSGLFLSLSLRVASAAEPPPLPPQPPAATQSGPSIPRIVSRPIRLRTNQVAGTGAVSVQGAVASNQLAFDTVSVPVRSIGAEDAVRRGLSMAAESIWNI